MLSTILVNIVVGVVKTGEDWLTLDLDWDVLSLGIDTVEGITSIVPLTLNIPHERATIRETAIGQRRP